MQLKSIEVIGFKSFADKTFIDLKGGTTAVVGPNGCGKSNIVDAVRWCMGEMSAKSLRSKQMLDVLFAGSSGRAATNMAEVTLTFDNMHHLLPLDYTEVQVTRRLFRSGESEYFLNKTQCRLKDIRDLFLDTGVTEGYSILAQGEVDFVLNAKPEERRELFEEAAGISKYKARREEALQKLDRVETDLSRLNDIITMLREQMGSLETAAKKARTFQKLKEELKHHELADAVSQAASFNAGIEAAQTRVNLTQASIQKAAVDYNNAEAQWTQARFELDEKEKEYYRLNSMILEIEKRVETSDHTLRLSREREQEIIQRKMKCSEQMKQSENELSMIQKKLAESEQDIAAAQTKVEELRNAFTAEKNGWKALEESRKALENEKTRLSEAVLQSVAAMNNLKNEQNKLNSLLLHKELDVTSIQRELAKYGEEQAKLTEEAGRLKHSVEEFTLSHSTLESEIAALHDSLNAQVTREKEISDRILDQRHALMMNETQLQSVQKTLASNPYYKGTQAALKQNFPGLKGVVGLLMQYNESMGRWVETALGSRVNWLVFERLEQAQAALEWLKTNRAGRATCLILDRLPQAQSASVATLPNASDLSSFVKCAPELESLKRYLFAQTFVSGNTLYAQGTVDGGSDDAETGSEEAFSSQNQFLLMEKHGKDMEAARAELMRLEADLTTVRGGIGQLRAQVAEKETALGRARLQKNHAEEILGTKSEEMSLCAREIAVLNERKEQDEKERVEMTQKIAALQQDIDAMLQKHGALETQRDDIQGKIEAKRAEEHQSQLTVRESEVRLESMQLHLSKSRESLNEWKHRLAEYRKTVEDTTNEIEHCKGQLLHIQETQKEETAKVQTLQTEKTGVSAQVEELLNAKSAQDEKVKSLETQVHSLRETQQLLSENAHQAEMDLRTQEADRKNVLRRLEENWQLTPEQAQEQLAQATVEPITADELAKLRKRVESMANSVNLEAPEQYQTLQERFTFLDTQTQDLLKAREDLKTTIQQINNTTRDQFKDTFAKVRENFRMIYSHLFQGGVADLVFTDETNLLDTGIDIVAQPPGKKPQSINLLSGGEKTLTATALLFAFFMVKPSPFCVLDEVDAPLDPANVSRFLNLLKDFSDKTQFLVVTHNPRTMEAADLLYGVTMEESGVSKVLSARLRREASSQTVELASV